MPELKFYKMQGAGNDFVVFDNRSYGLTLNQIIEITPQLCDRKFGIGADGLMALNPPNATGVDYTMIYRNADGSDAGMCGNGARCLSSFAKHQGFRPRHSFNVHNNVYTAEVENDENVSIHFPVEVKPEHIELEGKAFIKADAATEHLVCFREAEALEDENTLKDEGRYIRMHEHVNPPGTNVNFVHILEDESIELQTYERGVENLTLACGTGALASAIATHARQESRQTHASYLVSVKGGKLKVSFTYNQETGTYNNLILTGPAYFVFEGTIHL